MFIVAINPISERMVWGMVDLDVTSNSLYI